MTNKKYEEIKKLKNEFRENQIDEMASKYQASIVENNPSADAYDYYNAARYGALWADLHPCGFINEDEYINRVIERKDITNKEFIQMLMQFPDDALISVECCNPRAMLYDEENNLIRID